MGLDELIKTLGTDQEKVQEQLLCFAINGWRFGASTDQAG